MPARSISILVTVLAVAIVLTAGLLAYTSTVRQAASQPSQVTWRDPVGNQITSVTMVSSDSTLRTRTISFTCSRSLGPVSLQLSSSVPTLKVSPSSFAGCGTSPVYATLTVSSMNSVSNTAILQVVESDLYQVLPSQLTIDVRVS